MYENPKALSNGYSLKTQSPIDDRLIKSDIEDLIDLSNDRPYQYYEGMVVYVLSEKKFYEWVESSSGQLIIPFTYPNNIINSGIDYSNRDFNFKEISGHWNVNGNTNGSEKYIGTNDNFDLPFKVNNIERFKIYTYGDFAFGNISNAAGNLNIFTVDNGGSGIQILSNTNSNYVGSFKNINGYGEIDLRDSILGGNPIVRLTASGNPSYIINGNFGLGLSNPSAKLHIKGIDATSSNYAVKVDNVANGPLFNVTNNGNVGIGTSAPTAKLDVNGNIKVFNTLGDNDLIELRSTFYGNNLKKSINFTDSSASVGKISNVFNGNETEFVFGSLFNNGYTNANVMKINGSGNVLISEQNLLVNGVNSAKLRITTFDNSSDYFGLKIDDNYLNPLFNVRNDGNVGVGTLSPSSKFQVVGLDKYANNAAAMSGGLTAGAFYIRTGHGLDVVV